MTPGAGVMNRAATGRRPRQEVELAHRDAAVDGEEGAGGEGGLVGGEVDRDADDVLGLAEAAERGGGLKPGAGRLVAQQVCDERGLGGARDDRVDPNPLAGV